jgi:hypothetical protein
MAARPQRQVCPTCTVDDDDLLAWEVEGPGLWRYTCSNNRPDHPFTWLTTGRDRLNESGHEGLSNELGIYDDLLSCFTAGDPWLEYGVVEYRYAKTNQQAYKHLVELYSHTELGPTRYSASAFIGAALGHLGREGLLVRRPCRATGFWSYNGTLNAWALPPGRGPDDETTWEAFAAGFPEGASSWPLDELLRAPHAS